MREDSQELLDSLDIQAYCEDQGLTFKATRGHSGPQLQLKECPECGDRKWRVYLNAESGVGNCFVCSGTFNKATFIHATLGKPHWRDTFAHIKEAARLQGWRPKRLATAAVEAETAKFPESFPLPTPDGQNLLYLEQRGITTDLAKHFHLRFCERGWWNFTKEDGSRGGQRFDMRVIIPVYDLDGEFVTFQGRDITGLDSRKYLFPKGLPGTGRFLLNGQNAVGSKRAVIGEGGFDVFAMKRAFDEEVDLRDLVCLGSFGKHLSAGDPAGNDQLGRLRRLKRDGLKEVTMLWDGEEKALVAALDACKLITPLGLIARVALLPAGRDPNEVVPAIVRQAYREAQIYTPALDVKLRLKNPYASRAQRVTRVL